MENNTKSLRENPERLSCALMFLLFVRYGTIYTRFPFERDCAIITVFLRESHPMLRKMNFYFTISSPSFQFIFGVQYERKWMRVVFLYDQRGKCQMHTFKSCTIIWLFSRVGVFIRNGSKSFTTINRTSVNSVCVKNYFVVLIDEIDNFVLCRLGFDSVWNTYVVLFFKFCR